VFLETRKRNRQNYLSYIFTNPVDTIICHNYSEIKNAFERLKSYLSSNHYAAGFFSYEAGYSFEDSLHNLKRISKTQISCPLIWLGIFKSAIVFDHCARAYKGENKFLNNNYLSFRENRQQSSNYKINNLKLNIDQKSYINVIKKIKELIRNGEIYEVNYTMKYKFDFSGSAYKLYQQLANRQSVAYSAFIKTKNFKLLSFSPELFFRKRGKHIQTMPMKGTIQRGKNLVEDSLNKNRLKNDAKNKAENLMIVDLFRNDLSRISEVNSVETKDIFWVEKYETLFQMTSEINSVLKKDIQFYELFKAIFPSGSVTGAPKIRTMQIIRDMEKEPRQVYTGAIGLFKPNGDAIFNVAIRTILLQGEKGEMGVGSGIVNDSDPKQEYEECKLKGNFLTNSQKGFQLIETILWRTNSGFFLLKGHLKRLKESAEYFDFCYDENYIKKALSRIKKRFKENFSYKIRLLLFKNGDASISYRREKKSELAFNRSLRKKNIAISEHRTNSKDIFLYYKTTHRCLYNDEYKKYRKLGCYDVLFRNEKEEITEGAISNIFIKLKGNYYTPPVSCGLLNGIYRMELLKKRKNIKEKILTLKDIQNADKIYMTNSVRGMVDVRFKF